MNAARGDPLAQHASPRPCRRVGCWRVVFSASLRAAQVGTLGPLGSTVIVHRLGSRDRSPPLKDVTAAPVDIVDRISAGRLASLKVSDGFAAVVRTEDVVPVLSDVVAAGGYVTAALLADTLVGYVTVLAIEPIRWEGRVYRRRWEALESGRELGSIEVSRMWRGRQIAERLVRAAFSSGAHDAHIVISQELSWHWDYEALHLSKREYRGMLVRLLSNAGFKEFHTDDPNVATDYSNIFMARIGPRVSGADHELFRSLLVTRQPY